MNLRPRIRGARYGLAGATILAVLLSVGAQAGAVDLAPASADALQAWQTRIANVAQPSAKGCFTATYPRLVWKQTVCAAPPTTPMTPKPPGPTPLIIGGGNSIVAQTPAGPITQAFGSFESVSGVTGVSSPLTPTGAPVANAYTLQLNTNFFATAACAGAFNPALCLGWQQFVFANDGTSGRVYIEYWLLLYNTSCPGGWTAFPIGADTYCRQATPAAIVPSNTPITSMASFLLSGDISGTTDTVTMSIGTTVYSSSGTSIVDATGGWTQAEFNVFGYGSGTMATFNSFASTHVRTRINYGGTAAPTCAATGFTAETNNLNFGTPKPPSTPPGPAIIFLQNDTGGAVANCDSSESWGDTHQVTFAGLLYDFQASGDFVEAQVGSNFEVQTRKVSGAPNWPNTSVNRSVATRMGNTRVAICDGTRLVVDGRATELPSGGSLWLPAGVDIHRVGNVYYVRDKSGNSIRVAANTGYTDVKVGLGTWPTTVRGLLGNPNNNPSLLEARDGTQFSIPISFSDLYNRFGASWRVNPIASLLIPCNTVAAGNPSGPFFAGNLPADVRQRAEAACVEAGVARIWLDPCILDAGVVSPAAAQAFVGLEPPVVNGNQPANLARSATATASSTYPGYSPGRVNDGNPDTRVGGEFSWANDSNTYPPNGPQWVQLDFGSTRTFGRIVVLTSEGYPIQDFDVQVLSGGAWVTPAGGAVRGNTQLSRTLTFTSPQSSQYVRVLAYRGPSHQDGYVRVNELEVYPH